jgi:sec-independent protein translocase protein TatC
MAPAERCRSWSISTISGKRLIWSIVSALGGFVVGLAFIGYIFGFIMRPLAATLPEGRLMIYTEPTEAFLLQLKVAALAGARHRGPRDPLAAVALHRAGPLPPREALRGAVRASSSLLFVGGAAFSHYVVFPLAFRFFGAFGTDYMEFLPRIQPVFSSTYGCSSRSASSSRCRCWCSRSPSSGS